MKKSHYILTTILATFLVVSVGAVGALAISDEQYLAIPIGDTKCLDVNLPGDSGSTLGGIYSVAIITDLATNYRDYETTLISGAVEIHRPCLSANVNTVADGSIVDYTVMITSSYGSSKSYSGKVCVSDVSDQECAVLASNQPSGGCVSGQKRCVADRLERCSSAGEWALDTVCQYGCSNSQCVTNQGTPGSGDNPNLYVWVIVIGVIVIVVMLVLLLVFKSRKRSPRKGKRDIYKMRF